MLEVLPAVAASRAALLGRVAAMLPAWTEHAARLDAEGRAPEVELGQLRGAGALVAPMPTALGGLGLATEPSGAPGLQRLLRLIGRGNLVWPNLVERLLRDLATYLRQPAPDETLTEAAAWFTANDLPDLGPSGAHAGE